MQTFTISFIYQGCVYDAECIARCRESGVEYFILPRNNDLLAIHGPTVIWKEPDDIHRHLRDSSSNPEYAVAVTSGLFRYFASVA
jgi:hypothetical protein